MPYRRRARTPPRSPGRRRAWRRRGLLAHPHRRGHRSQEHGSARRSQAAAPNSPLNGDTSFGYGGDTLHEDKMGVFCAATSGTGGPVASAMSLGCLGRWPQVHPTGWQQAPGRCVRRQRPLHREARLDLHNPGRHCIYLHCKPLQCTRLQRKCFDAVRGATTRDVLARRGAGARRPRPRAAGRGARTPAGRKVPPPDRVGRADRPTQLVLPGTRCHARVRARRVLGRRAEIVAVRPGRPRRRRRDLAELGRRARHARPHPGRPGTRTRRRHRRVPLSDWRRQLHRRRAAGDLGPPAVPPADPADPGWLGPGDDGDDRDLRPAAVRARRHPATARPARHPRGRQASGRGRDRRHRHLPDDRRVPEDHRRTGRGRDRRRTARRRSPR